MVAFFITACFLFFFSGGNYKFPICFKAELQIRLNMWLGRGVRSPFLCSVEYGICSGFVRDAFGFLLGLMVVWQMVYF